MSTDTVRRARPTAYLSTAQSAHLDSVTRYEALGLTHRQARLLAKLDYLKQDGTGTMLLVNPSEMTWGLWRVVPDGLISG